MKHSEEYCDSTSKDFLRSFILPYGLIHGVTLPQGFCIHIVFNVMVNDLVCYWFIAEVYFHIIQDLNDWYQSNFLGQRRETFLALFAEFF